MVIVLQFVTFSYQQTPLHISASKGLDYTVEWLVKKGAEMDIKDNNGVYETILLMVDKYLTLSIRILLSIPSLCSMGWYTMVHPTVYPDP